jgi:HPt (histidine-containing phosphotransfer) domain-containing protein
MTNENPITVNIDADLEDLIPQFMENTRNDILSMNDAVAANDLETVRRIGHSMKSYGIGYGFDHISTLGKTIENAATGGDASLIHRTLEEMTSYLNKVKVIYD